MAQSFRIGTIRTGGLVLALAGAGLLTGCQGGQPLGFLAGKPAVGAETPATQETERDVEAPQVFSAEEQGLWDGRPSLGGVWVAHPYAKDPERVMIRNPANGQSVIGALFRRERDNPGPSLQVSSDAAEALGLLAGAPTKLAVVALRRETVPVAPPAAEPLAPGMALAKEDPIETQSLDAVTDAADKALSAAEGKPATKPAPKPAAKPAAKPEAAKPAAPALPPGATATPSAPKAPAGKMFVQLGIFSVEANATATQAQMSKQGIIATIRKEESKGKTFWRVLAGPAASATDRAALLKKVQSLGYTDAYAVSK